jgi:hypothetical protein
MAKALALQIEEIEAAALALLEVATPFMEGCVKQLTVTAFSEELGEWDIEITEDEIRIVASERP